VQWAVEICSLSFLIFYGLATSWFRYWEGRALFILTLDFVIWFAVNLVNMRWPLSVRAAVIGSWLIGAGICASFLTFLITGLKARARAKRGRRSAPKEGI
jgi:type VI protein secretion system component VasK